MAERIALPLGFTIASLTIPFLQPAVGNAYPQEDADKEKIVKGYRRLEYLLENWEKETTFCKSDNPYIGCDRSPEKVMDVSKGWRLTHLPSVSPALFQTFHYSHSDTPEFISTQYLGYKSIEDPLFRAEKTLKRLQKLVPESNEQDQNDFQDALEVFSEISNFLRCNSICYLLSSSSLLLNRPNVVLVHLILFPVLFLLMFTRHALVEKAEEGNGYAYISSWGEANPGGGKDRVALFIERSKNDVTEAKNSLATVIRILGL